MCSILFALQFRRTKVFNETSFNEWVDEARAPALAASLRLYEELLVSGFHIILLTGRNEAQRKVTVENLLHAGYHSWRSLIFRFVNLVVFRLNGSVSSLTIIVAPDNFKSFKGHAI